MPVIEEVLMQEMRGEADNLAIGNANSSTTYERASLGHAHNVSDAHARQPLGPSEIAIVERFPGLLREALSRPSLDLEPEFVADFFALAGQYCTFPQDRYLLSYSASTAITMIASLFRRMSKSVALVAPCFDNIPRILLREQVKLYALSETQIFSTGIPTSSDAAHADVIWVVCPNNPTGAVLNRSTFAALVQFYHSQSKILVLDFSFRFFSPDMGTWDQYRILTDAGVSFITIEDTGKTWPTAEMKIGMTVSSEDLFPLMYKLHDDLLQAVSTFHLTVIREFIRNSATHPRSDTIYRYVSENRRVVRHHLVGTRLISETPADSVIPVEWLRLPDGVTGQMVRHHLLRDNIHILPGANFYWDAPELGSQFVRIALNRPTDLIAGIMPRFVEAVSALEAEQIA
jgi:aspartate/methionine/tyrosine aminotransferase